MTDTSIIIQDEEILERRMISSLNTFISSQSCVLLLGPLFGIDKDTNKLHKSLKKRLTDPPNNLNLDDEFDNVYVSRNSDGTQNAYLIDEIHSFYSNVERHFIYDMILQIGFRAIITYTSDHLLCQANKELKKYDFYYFSAKGNQFVEEKLNISKKPIIYNIFGSIEDLNSLITDYDSLYDFLLNILKADQEFPLELKNILSNAKAFLLLGFDLSKWYIPLIVRKLNQFILNGNRVKSSISAFACLDDTPFVPSIDSLNKYPLLFKPFDKLNSFDLIHKLAALSKNSPTEGDLLKSSRLPTQSEKDFFLKWTQQMSSYGAPEGLRLFFREYKELRYGGLLKKEFDLLNMQFNETENQKMSFRLNDEDFIIGCNKIIDSIFHFISQLP